MPAPHAKVAEPSADAGRVAFRAGSFVYLESRAQAGHDVAPAASGGEQSAKISIRSSWLKNLGLIGASVNVTWPASMNHSDPQLSDTPTRAAASDPDKPDRISSK